MNTYIHKVHYYETDKMGITHHSNYVKWMQEARTDYLHQNGYGMSRLEADGITSPVISVECQYKYPTTFDDEVKIEVSLEEYSGVKLVMNYIMTNLETGMVVLTAKSSHCFIDSNGIPIAIKKYYPEFDVILKELAIKK